MSRELDGGVLPASIERTSTLPREAGRAAQHVVALRAVLRNGLSLLGAYVLPRAFTIAAIAIAARVLGAEQFGAYGTAAGFAVVLSVFATLGMAPLLTRDIAREPARAAELLHAAQIVKTMSSLIMLVLSYALVRLLDYPPVVQQAALLLGLAYAIGAYVENFAAYYQAVERMHVWMQASALFGLVTGALGALFAMNTRSIVWFSLAPVGGQIAALLYLRARLPRTVKPDAAASRRAVGELLRDVAPFGFAFVALAIYSKVDVLLLTEWTNSLRVGLYTAAYKFVDIVQALIVVAVAATFPRLARRTDVADGQRWAGTRVVELVVMAVTVGAGVIWLVRAELIALVFGEEYAPAAAALGFLAAALPAIALNTAAAFVLGVRGQMQKVGWAYVGAIAVSVMLNALLITRYEAAGAAAARLGSEVLLSLGLVVVLQRYAAGAPGAAALRAIGATVLLATAFTFLPDSTSAVLRVAGYLLLVFGWFRWARVFEPAELSALRQLLRPAGSAVPDGAAGR